MRKVILGFGLSLDGYLARPDGSVDFLVMDADTRKLMAAFFRTIDTAVMGRKTAELSMKMMGDSGEPPMRLPAYVFSRTWPPGKRGYFEVVNQTPAAFLRKLRAKPGKNIFLMGGGELGRSFLEADLVDELSLGFVPVLLGEGIPAFPGGFPQRNFTLAECRTYSKHGVALTYRRVRRKVNPRR